jgi:hypothetical protein
MLGQADAISIGVKTTYRIESINKSMRLFLLALALILLSNFGTAQSIGKGSSEGKLTVTATVMASASLVIEPDGRQVLIVANAADPRDNVSQLLAITENSPNKRDKKSVQIKKSNRAVSHL